MLGFNIRNECEPCRPGFNFYPLSCRGSRGFIFVGFGLRVQMRWSRAQARWCKSVERI